jgi:hypothetical protein
MYCVVQHFICNLSVYDSSDIASETTLPPSHPSSLAHMYRIQSHTLPTSTFLTFTCTQVLRCLSRLTWTRDSGVTIDPSVLVFSLSLYRHPFTCILCRSRFPSYHIFKLNFHLRVPVPHTTQCMQDV